MKVNGTPPPHSITPNAPGHPFGRPPGYTYLRLRQPMTVPLPLRAAAPGAVLFDRDFWNVSARCHGGALTSLWFRNRELDKAFILLVDAAGVVHDVAIPNSNARNVHEFQAAFHDKLMRAPRDLPLYEPLRDEFREALAIV